MIDLAERVWVLERRTTESTDLSEAVIRNFFKLLAYKDEYEVARMLTDPSFVDSIQTQIPGATNVTYRLHPPILKTLGLKKKIGLGPRTHGVLRLLAKGKRLRGTPFDPFGYARMRRLERRLNEHYEHTIDTLLESLTLESYEHAVAVACAPDLIRGYEDVKMRSLASYLAKLDELAVDATAFRDEPARALERSAKSLRRQNRIDGLNRKMLLGHQATEDSRVK